MSGSGMYQRLASLVSDGSAGSFSFQNIPVSGYAGLVLTAKVRQQRLSDFPFWSFRFNEDQTSNIYNSGSLFMSGYDYGAQSLGEFNSGDNRIYVIRNPEGRTSGNPRWAPNAFQYYKLFMPNAGSSTQFKTARHSAVASNNISTPYAVSNTGISYKSTSPITRIDIFVNENWTAGTEFILYGYGPQ